jgi:peptide/nickel transport system substrate-binding protein
MQRLFCACWALVMCLVAVGPAASEPVHAIAMHGTPKLPADFASLPYANPDAPKGGRLRLGLSGSFDTLNPLIVKGEKVAGVREFCVESLMTRSLDEPFTLYPLLAESVEMPEDRTSITFHLNPKATFSDGTPVTADDVVFSLQLLRDKGVPTIHRAHYKKVLAVERLSDRAVRMTMDGQDRELPLLLGLMPVLSKRATDAATFDQATSTPLIGSGPYVFSRVEQGRSVIYKRNPDYWGRDLPVSRGRFNFDEIRYEYYRDATTLLEAFKLGLVDVRVDDDPATWAKTGRFQAVKEGRVVREEMPIGLPAGMNALVMNTRRSAFADQRVRQALILLFDFEWINATLYDGLYKRTQSYFERSYLASSGRTADARERELLAPFADSVTPAVMDGTFRLPVSDGSGFNRENARRALALFQDAGYEVRDGKLVERASGKPYGFEILIVRGGAERLMLAYIGALKSLGIDANLRLIDSAQLTRRINAFDFDVVMQTWQQSLSPGNEAYGRFGAAAAKLDGSRNYAGIANPAVDAMITAMLAAHEPDAFVSAVRALDRVLMSGDYVIPLFYVPTQWVSSWADLRHPGTVPLAGYNIDTWWRRPEAKP